VLKRVFRGTEAKREVPKMTMLRENTHIVIKRDDVNKYLTDSDRYELVMLLNKIDIGRQKDGKKLNSYYVCNTDEPYADNVLGVILDGEDHK
jgi:hypothetical protein